MCGCFIIGEKNKLLEEREQEKEKTTAHVGKADRVMAEVEELKGKMRSIELEKTTLQASVSSQQFNMFKQCLFSMFYFLNLLSLIKTRNILVCVHLELKVYLQETKLK